MSSGRVVKKGRGIKGDKLPIISLDSVHVTSRSHVKQWSSAVVVLGFQLRKADDGSFCRFPKSST